MVKDISLSLTLDEYIKLPDLGSNSSEKDLLMTALRMAHIPFSSKYQYKILKKSIDARKKNAIRITFLVRLYDKEPISADNPVSLFLANPIMKQMPPVVVGFGPAGIFAALILARAGLCPIILERGAQVDQREEAVATFFSGGQLNVNSNVQFGEGGAGTFSDGKLYTGVSSPYRAYILQTFIASGAPEEIAYLTHPHIGTDRLRGVVKSIREEIIRLGGEFRFNTQMTDIVLDKGSLMGIMCVDTANPSREESATFLPARHVILAIGHSARDTFRMLKDRSISLQQKPFSVGVRIEHLQEWMNTAQYGAMASHPALSPAEYKAVSHQNNGRALYTFCMCPGGYVVGSASGINQTVTNGMSYYDRSGINANSAILVPVDARDFGESDVLAGMYFQESLEKNAFLAGGKNGFAPCQRWEDFLHNRSSISCGEVQPTYKPGVTYTNLREYLPAYITDTICNGIPEIARKISNFAHPDSLLTGFETRSSSPIRILRDANYQSLSLPGVYLCGEGAGYAGGIMSSAIDGIECANRCLKTMAD